MINLLFLYDAEDVVLAHDQALLAVDLHLGPRILAEKDPVARRDIRLDQLAVFSRLSLAHGDNQPFHRLLLGGVGNDYPPLGRRLLFKPLDDHPVLSWSDFHALTF